MIFVMKELFRYVEEGVLEIVNERISSIRFIKDFKSMLTWSQIEWMLMCLINCDCRINVICYIGIGKIYAKAIDRYSWGKFYVWRIGNQAKHIEVIDFRNAINCVKYDGLVYFWKIKICRSKRFFVRAIFVCMAGVVGDWSVLDL